VANVEKLKGRTSTMSEEGTLTEIFAEYLRDRGDRTLIIDRFPTDAKPYGAPLGTESRERRGRPPATYLPEIKDSPRTEKACIVAALTDKKIRFATRDFANWLQMRELPTYGFVERMQTELGAKRIRCVIGMGTKYAGPRVHALEIDITQAGFSNLDESLGSSTDP
jgi:hypothetical protein